MVIERSRNEAPVEVAFDVAFLWPRAIHNNKHTTNTIVNVSETKSGGEGIKTAPPAAQNAVFNATERVFNRGFDVDFDVAFDFDFAVAVPFPLRGRWREAPVEVGLTLFLTLTLGLTLSPARGATLLTGGFNRRINDRRKHSKSRKGRHIIWMLDGTNLFIAP